MQRHETGQPSSSIPTFCLQQNLALQHGSCAGLDLVLGVFWLISFFAVLGNLYLCIGGFVSHRLEAHVASRCHHPAPALVGFNL
ncbi:MAG: hypothetical protein RLZZ397_47 [Pseudomonadota bacterium]